MSVDPQPRGILPTYVDDDRLVLCKAGPTVRNAYEIRLALFFAVDSARRFVLQVQPGASVAADLRALLTEHDASLTEETAQEFSVYFGAAGPDGVEIDGWVLGDNAAWISMLRDLRTPWLREVLRPGAEFGGTDLARLKDALAEESVPSTNVDGEPFDAALLQLVAEATAAQGVVFVQ